MYEMPKEAIKEMTKQKYNIWPSKAELKKTWKEIKIEVKKGIRELKSK
jgi:hypothetical protein